MGFRKAQSDAHSELTPNFAAQAADILLLPAQPKSLASLPTQAPKQCGNQN
ncbi:hypothetical protein [Lapidilactobacillus salsurivasis]